MKTKELLLNVPLRDLPSGHKITIPFDGDMPVERYWRDRLRDAETDNCVEVVVVKKRETKVTGPSETKISKGE
ncbi:MAG: hypothetical protein V3U60_16280 [Gammaproteobacteria bacterium]